MNIFKVLTPQEFNYLSKNIKRKFKQNIALILNVV